MPENENKNLINLQHRAFELCLAIYRMTNLFPSGEALVNQLRGSSAQVIVLLATARIHDTISKVEEVKIYLAIARAQNWLKSINFDLLESSYSLLGQALEQFSATRTAEPRVVKEPEKKQEATPLPLEKPGLAGSRQRRERRERRLGVTFKNSGQRAQRIIDFIGERKKAYIADLVNFVGSVSERTIRTDLAELIGRKQIKKVGITKNAYYTLR